MGEKYDFFLHVTQSWILGQCFYLFILLLFGCLLCNILVLALFVFMLGEHIFFILAEESQGSIL